MYGFCISLYQTNKITFTERPVNFREPIIEGDPIPGLKVICNPGEWYYVTSNFSYQWLIDGEPIDRATDQSYNIDARDAGRVLSCSVSASNVYGLTKSESPGVTVER